MMHMFLLQYLYHWFISCKKIIVINLNRTILGFISCPLDNSKLEFIWPIVKSDMKKLSFQFYFI
jgi:hypothetical protein